MASAQRLEPIPARRELPANGPELSCLSVTPSTPVLIKLMSTASINHPLDITAPAPQKPPPPASPTPSHLHGLFRPTLPDISEDEETANVLRRRFWPLARKTCRQEIRLHRVPTRW
jgi:hypothetical protein